MTDLSPAAQALFDAVCVNWETYPVKDHQACIAYVLRAAADQVENLYCDGDVEDSPGVVFALRQLMLIAAELEAFAD
jgi:hypothetical protein